MKELEKKLYPLNLPKANIELFQDGDELYFHDIIRNKKLILTPEEWVRQHLIHYLIYHFNYPKNLFQLEAPVKFNGLSQRSDIVVYDMNGKVFLLVECKSYSVKITGDAFDQAIRYNSKVNAQYVLISNGLDHHCFHINNVKRTVEVMDAFPEYVEI